MISIKDFYDVFYDSNVDFYITYYTDTVVDFYKQINKSKTPFYTSQNDKSYYKTRGIQNVLVANEKNTIGTALGYNLSTTKCPIVYMDCSAFENCLGALHIYKEIVFPTVFLVFADKSETEKLEAFLSFDKNKVSRIDCKSNYQDIIKSALDYANKNSQPAFLLIDKDSFEKPKDNTITASVNLNESEVIKYMLSFINPKDILLISDNTISNYVFDFYKKLNNSTHNALFFNNSYAQLSQIAYAISKNTDKKIYCIDTISNFYANAGGVLMALEKSDRNLKYIIIDDTELDPTNPITPINSLNIKKTFKSIGIKNIIEGYTYEDIQIGMLRLAKEKAVVVVKVTPDLRSKIQIKDTEFNNSSKQLQRFIFIE